MGVKVWTTKRKDLETPRNLRGITKEGIMKMRKYERNTHVVRAARILCAVADRRRRGPPSAFETTDAQVKSLAKRQLVCSLAAEEHAGVYLTVLD